MAYICGQYDRKAKTISRLCFVLLLTEELRENYAPGQTLVVGPKHYILTNRQLVDPGTVVQYDMIAQKGD